MTELATCPECGRAVRGTVEVVQGSALADFWLRPDGSVVYHHTGSSEMFWDTSENKTLHGEIVVDCIEGHEFKLSEIVFLDENGKPIDKPAPDDKPKPAMPPKLAIGDEWT